MSDLAGWIASDRTALFGQLKAAAPTLLRAGGTLMQGRSAVEAGEANAAMLAGQARAARNQSTAQEEQLRRDARLKLGKQIAAVGESGGGYGGSAGLLLDQSRLLTELDALNIRSEGDNRARGLLAQSRAARRQGRQAGLSSGLLAGTQLLMGS